MKVRVLPVLPLLLALGAAPSVQADELKVTLGPALLYAPEFSGAEDNELKPVPFVDIRYGDWFFASYMDGIGARLFEHEGFSFGPLLRPEFGRDEEDSSALAGLGDIDFGVEAGGFLRYDYGRGFNAKLELRQAIGGHEGFVGDVGAALNLPLAENVFVSLNPYAKFGDSTYNDAFYGISAAQSAASGYTVHDTGFGFNSAGANVILLFMATEEISVAGFGGYSRLLGDAADSPLVKGPGGSPDQFILGAGLTYTFKMTP